MIYLLVHETKKHIQYVQARWSSGMHKQIWQQNLSWHLISCTIQMSMFPKIYYWRWRTPWQNVQKKKQHFVQTSVEILTSLKVQRYDRCVETFSYIFATVTFLYLHLIILQLIHYWPCNLYLSKTLPESNSDSCDFIIVV